ncbi:MAG: tetratricopeptide repeat protein, partial [Pseudomonadota bacterium]
MGRLDSAQYYLQTALAQAEGCRDNYLFSLAAHDLGQTFDRQGKTKVAKGLFEQALEAAQERKAPSNELINAAYRLFEMSKAEGDYRSATQYLELWGVAKDSLFNLDKTKQMTRIELEYNFESEKQALITANEREQIV